MMKVILFQKSKGEVMKRSFIREILEHTTNKTISFAGGLPDETLFAHTQLQYSAQKVLNNAHSLQYTTSTGIASLKKKIAQWYCKEGFETKSSNILITSGSQQALDIIARYNNHKDITIEAPSYLGAMNVFDLNHLTQHSIHLENDGINIDRFEKDFQTTKLAYLIPDYQNPTGISYSDTKRQQIATIIQQHNGILIEDSPYSELYFDKKYTMISSMLPNQSFHLGSFSKTLAPALRIGWIRADEKLLQPLIAYKEAMDLHTNALSQYIIDDYLEDTVQYDKHLQILRKIYAKKMQIFTTYLDEILPWFHYIKPKGGMFIYGSFSNINTSQLLQQAIKENVVFVPGSEFYRENFSQNEIRFNFTHCSTQEIYRGLTQIAKIINKEDAQ